LEKHKIETQFYPIVNIKECASGKNSANIWCAIISEPLSKGLEMKCQQEIQLFKAMIISWEEHSNSCNIDLSMEDFCNLNIA